MKAAFFEIESWEKEHIRKKIKNSVFFEDKLTYANADKVKDCDIISVFIYSQIDKKLLDLLPKLKLIATRSTGVDHIDVKECTKRKITVVNVPSYGENTVAEHTFGLILSLSRKIHQSYVKTSKGEFSTDGLRGFDLKGKTLGVIGTGKIGIHVIRIAQGFEMKVIAHDAYMNKKLEKENSFSYVTLAELLKQSDIITMHVPLIKETFHMINKKNISQIKKGALLINTARGGLIETEALLKALNSGILSGAGLDVLEEEHEIKEEKQLVHQGYSKKHNIKTLLENHVLMHYENVLITPHNAFNSKEALIRIIDTTLENIAAHQQGKILNKINKKIS